MVIYYIVSHSLCIIHKTSVLPRAADGTYVFIQYIVYAPWTVQLPHKFNDTKQAAPIWQALWEIISISLFVLSYTLFMSLFGFLLLRKEFQKMSY